MVDIKEENDDIDTNQSNNNNKIEDTIYLLSERIDAIENAMVNHIHAISDISKSINEFSQMLSQQQQPQQERSASPMQQPQAQPSLDDKMNMLLEKFNSASEQK